MLVVLLISTIFLSVFSTVLEKKFQLSVKNNIPTMLMMNLVNGIFGCVYFLFLCKFNVQMNLTTFAFSFGYAMIVFDSLVISVVALSKMSIPVKTIVGMLGSVLGSVVVGRIFFNEKIAINSVLAVLFLFAAVIIPYVKSKELKTGKNPFWVCIWLFLTFAVSSVYLKFYTENPNSLDANNMFFMTNFICLIICALAVIICMIAKKQYRSNMLNAIGIKHIANIGLRTALSNISSIITVFIISVMDVSVYTVITSSLGLIAGVLVSRLIFCEDLTWKNYVSVAFAVISVILQVL